MYLVINKYVTAVILSNFSRHYLCKRSTLDIGVLGYISVFQLKEHSPEVWHIPPGTPYIYIYIYIFFSFKLTSSDLLYLGSNRSRIKHRLQQTDCTQRQSISSNRK